MGNLFTKEAYDHIKNLELKSLLKYFEVPKDVVPVAFKTNIITDLVQMETFFNELSKYNRIGIFSLFEGRIFWGLVLR